MDCQANFSEVFQQSIKFSLKNAPECTIYTFKYQKAPTEGVGKPPSPPSTTPPRVLRPLVSATPFPPILAKFPSILKLIYIPGYVQKNGGTAVACHVTA